MPQPRQQHDSKPASKASEGRKISCEDIQLVQNLIERCLQLYMNRKEVIHTLQSQADVEPGFTQLVWVKLEEQNPEFFKAYYTRLKLKTHITTFNQLLEQQAELMRKAGLLTSRMYHHTEASHSTPTDPQLSSFLDGTSRRPDVLATASCNEVGGLHTNTPDTMFSFGQSGDLSGMGMASLDGSYSHDQQSIDGLTSADTINNSNMARVFSLSDLTDIGPKGKFPRNFSLSDLTADLGPSDFANFSSAFVTSEAEEFLQTPERDGFDEEPMLDFVE